MDNQNTNNNSNIETLDVETLDLGTMDLTPQPTPAQPVAPSIDTTIAQQPVQSTVVEASKETPVATEVPVSQPEIVQDQAPSFVKPVEQPTTTDDLLNAVPKPDIMVSSPDANSISSEDLLEDYVGKNYDKISKRKFNLAAFFFGGFYFAYRKMIFEGLMISLIVVALSFATSLVNPFITMVVTLVSSIIFCLLFNKIYLSSSKKKIDSIRNKNKAKSISDIKRICAKKGGTNIIYAILVSIISSAILSTVITNFFPTYIEDLKSNYLSKSTQNKSTPTDNNDNTNNKPEEQQNSVSQLNYRKSGYMEDKADVGFLTIFKETTSKTDAIYDYEIQTIEGNENSYCKFNLAIIDDYDSSITLINELANYYEASATISTLESGTNLWNTFERTNNTDREYYAAANNDSNEVFLFKYTIQSESNETLCKAYYTGILNSIKFK